MSDMTNKYKSPQKRQAYEVALSLASQVEDPWDMGNPDEIARQLDHDLSCADRRQVAAKALRTTRGRRDKGPVGRPPEEGEVKVPKSITLTPEQVRYLTDLGRNNLSRGIRIVTDAHMRRDDGAEEI